MAIHHGRSCQKRMDWVCSLGQEDNGQNIIDTANHPGNPRQYWPALKPTKSQTQQAIVCDVIDDSMAHGTQQTQGFFMCHRISKTYIYYVAVWLTEAVVTISVMGDYYLLSCWHFFYRKHKDILISPIISQQRGVQTAQIFPTESTRKTNHQQPRHWPSLPAIFRF